MKKKNKITLLDELRQEIEIVRKECTESEERLSEQWQYLTENAPSLLMDSAVSGIAGWFGFGHKEKKNNKGTQESSEPVGVMQTVWNGLMLYSPLIWEVAQPLLWRFTVNKIKSVFSGSKKKKKRKYDDD